MSIKPNLNLDDLEARAHDLDDAAADDVTGGWSSKKIKKKMGDKMKKAGGKQQKKGSKEEKKNPKPQKPGFGGGHAGKPRR